MLKFPNMTPCLLPFFFGWKTSKQQIITHPILLHSSFYLSWIKILKHFRSPLTYNFWKLGKSCLFHLMHDNSEFLISLCLFVSELTLKIVFLEKSWKLVMDLKKCVWACEFWCFCTIVLNSSAYSYSTSFYTLSVYRYFPKRGDSNDICNYQLW